MRGEVLQVVGPSAQLASSKNKLYSLQHSLLCLHSSLPCRNLTMRPVTRLGNAALRRATRTRLHAQSPANCIMARASVASSAVRAYRPSMALASIMPDAENPAPPKSEATDQPTAATEIPTSEFHERADKYLNELVERLEELQNEDPTIDVEYSVFPFIVTTVSSLLTAATGWRPRGHSQGQQVCAQQAASEQADLAQLADIWSEALRLGGVAGGHQLQGRRWCW